MDEVPASGPRVADAAVYGLVFDEAVRALDDQRSVLDNMRTRSGIVLSAAAVTTSFFGGLALRDGSPGWLGWAAVVAFVTCGVAGLVTLFPLERWEFRASPESLIAEIETTAPRLDAVQRDLALYMEQSWSANARRIQLSLVWPLRIATVALVIEVLAWVLDLSEIG